MNEEEKETIKYFYNLRALIDENNMLYDEGIGKKYGKEKIRQITIILNLIEKLQKENEELKNQEATARRINELLVQRYSNSIPVQKVKDKIEELNNNRQYLFQFKDYKEKNYTNEEVVNNCVEVLQELLESE